MTRHATAQELFDAQRDKEQVNKADLDYRKNAWRQYWIEDQLVYDFRTKAKCGIIENVEGETITIKLKDKRRITVRGRDIGLSKPWFHKVRGVEGVDTIYCRKPK